MALRITPPAVQHVAAGLTSTNNKRTITAAVKLVARKRTDLFLSCEYRNDFTRPIISIPRRSLLEIVAAYSHDAEGGKDKNLNEKLQEDQNSLDISVLQNSSEIIQRLKLQENSLDISVLQNSSEIIQRLKLQDCLHENELHEHLASLGDTVWDLRLHLCYEHRDGQFILTGATIHGLWKSHVKYDKVVSDIDDDEYTRMKPRALELAEKVLKIPSMSAKLRKMWRPTNHTTKLKDFIAHEMAKHGFLSLWYFVITLEAASPYFDENGNFLLLKTMKEMRYVKGKFNCLQFQTEFKKRLGYQILVTYGDKKEKGKLYPREIGFLLGGNIKKMNYMLPRDADQEHDDEFDDEFFLDGIDNTM